MLHHSPTRSRLRAMGHCMYEAFSLHGDSLFETVLVARTALSSSAAVQPPPSDLISRTLETIRRRMISTSLRSLDSAIVCAMRTWRYGSAPAR